MSERIAVAVVHYHLRPGGVTRVIERAIAAMCGRADCLVFSGEAPGAGSPLVALSEPFHALAYGQNPAAPEAERLAKDLRFTARALFGRDPDLWHIHNHALGKNAFLPRFVHHLATAGCRILLQPHDFAEDGRPENYRLLKEHLGGALEGTLYPAARHVWYAPINHRDRSLLQEIGLRQIHVLPNAVTPHPPAAGHGPDRKPSPRTVVYPARAIRRKNIGEFLLWSLLAPGGYLFQSTLAPQNPQWQGIYREWVDFADELGLPVEFDAGRRHDFAVLVRDAEVLITTSIAEGFGLAFLEPWIEGKRLVGRKLPEITSDFERDGLDLSGLYERLPVPLEWIGEEDFLAALEAAMRKSYAAYAMEWTPELLHAACRALVVDGTVDFGILDESLQRRVIRHIAEHPMDRDRFPPFDPSPESGGIDHNRKIAGATYSPEAYGNRLLGIYRTLAAIEPGPVSHASAGKLLRLFLRPERFNLLST